MLVLDRRFISELYHRTNMRNMNKTHLVVYTVGGRKTLISGYYILVQQHLDSSKALWMRENT